MPNYVAAKAVGSFVPKLTQKAFEKFGFSAGSLLTDWSKIAGEDLARFTAPERLKWPRRFESSGDEGEQWHGQQGATLVLRVDPARALDVEYKAAQIVERINAYFGYLAVAELRILQAPLANHGRPVGRVAPQSPALQTCSTESDGLSAALARMQAGIASRRRSA